MKALPDGDTDKLSRFGAFDTAIRLLTDLVLDLGKAQELVNKANDDKKDAGANREIEGIVAGLEKGDAKDPKADAKQLKDPAGQIDDTNKTDIKARANQEVAQALSRPENAKYAETVKAALAFFQTSADKAAAAAKKYA